VVLVISSWHSIAAQTCPKLYSLLVLPGRETNPVQRRIPYALHALEAALLVVDLLYPWVHLLVSKQLKTETGKDDPDPIP
jgi:hypothetical protein